MDFAGIVQRLDLVDERPPLTDPYAIVLHQNAGYLVDDERRDRLFARLTALAKTPAALLRADRSKLLAIAVDGGMHAEQRVERWRDIARHTLDAADGDLDATLRALPIVKARRLLKGYPAIGDPGADHALLFAGIAARATVESNGLRVLARLGFVREEAPYATAYREAVAVLHAAFGADIPDLQHAYTKLRAHGKTLCRRNAPVCAACPVRALCPVGRKAARTRRQTSAT